MEKGWGLLNFISSHTFSNVLYVTTIYFFSISAFNVSFEYIRIKSGSVQLNIFSLQNPQSTHAQREEPDVVCLRSSRYVAAALESW